MKNILTIKTNRLLGNIKKTIRNLTVAFQPDKYTRFSGILFVRTYKDIKEKKIEFNFINNPFAKHPVDKELINLGLQPIPDNLSSNKKKSKTKKNIKLKFYIAQNV